MRRLRCSALKWLVFVLVAISLSLCTFILVVMNVPSCKTWLGNKLVTTDIDIEDIRLREVRLTSVLVDVTVSVENTSSIGVKLDRIAYVIYFEEDGEWVELGEGERTDDVVIGGKSSTSFDIANRIEFVPSIRALYQLYNQGGSIDFKVAGSAWLKVWAFSFEIPFERIKKLGL
jgi:LEA14-like dessication related protein